MSIELKTYELFSKAIHHSLKQSKTGISFTDIVKGIKKYFKEKGIAFRGSVGWYAVTVKHDMEAGGIIEIQMEKGRKLHSLSPSQHARR